MKSNLLKFIFTFLFVFIVVPNNVKAQTASPMQSGHYLPAFTNIRDMAQPPPGFFILVYNNLSFTDTYFDRNGDKFKTLSLSEIDPNFPDLEVDPDLNAFVSVPAFFWASNFQILGGARYMAGITPVYMSAGGSVILENEDSDLHEKSSGSVSGFSDLMFVPLGLSWGFEKYDLTFMYSVTAPTGRYETGGTENLGLGFWTNQFQGFGYYYPKPDKSTALMLGLTYELNGEIKDIDVKPGNRFSLEYGISQYLSERLEVGIQGGHNWQVSDDEGDDVFWDPRYHDQKSSLYFSAAYWVWKQRLQLNFKYGFDYNVKQRFKTNAFMLNITFMTNALDGIPNTKRTK